MFVRTGVNEYSLAVLISDPRREDFNQIIVIAIQSILDLRKKDRIKCDPSVDFTNGYDAGLVDIDKYTRKKLIRWSDNGMVITIIKNVSGSYKFGRVPKEKLNLTEEEDFWLKAWAESMDFETERQLALQEPVKKTKVKKKPKVKRKNRHLKEFLKD